MSHRRPRAPTRGALAAIAASLSPAPHRAPGHTSGSAHLFDLSRLPPRGSRPTTGEADISAIVDHVGDLVVTLDVTPVSADPAGPERLLIARAADPAR